MECNKDEALRAKEIAERKFNASDIGGAKKFALKAQNLFPSLDGISQMIATLDVHLSAVNRIDGEKDWYAILGVNPSADDETVKKQYRKLALQLHPDKNKSIGAESAFQLISEAWSVLSDKNKRMLYHHKRFGKLLQQKSAPVKKDRSVPNTFNGFHNSGNFSAAKPGVPQSNTGAAQTSFSSNPPSSQPPKSSTFWTSCNLCKMQYEYLRVYLNYNLICPNCRKPFVAAENGVPLPPKVPNASTPTSRQHFQQNANLHSTTKNGHGVSSSHHVGAAPNFNGNSNFQWPPFSRPSGATSVSDSSAAAAQSANVVQKAYEKVRRELEEARAKKEEDVRRWNVKRGSAGQQSNEHILPNVDKLGKRRRGMADDTRTSYGGETGNSGKPLDNFSKSSLTSRKSLIKSGFPQKHIVNTLVKKSKDEIHKMVEAWTSVREVKSAEMENAKKQQKLEHKLKEKVKKAVHENSTKVDLPTSTGKNAYPKRTSNSENADADNEVVEPVSIDVPDPDFHDFDNDRSERSFQSDDIWATYDDEDGMPRYYALIQKVISCKPFKVRMSFLTSKSNSEFGPLNWVGAGFAKTSGEFRVSRYEVKDTLNMFSHKVKWEKGLRGVIRIVPRKGEIWALYRNWSPDWSEHTPDDVMYKYDMVEVLEDYNDEQGVSVTPLVKVAGFRTVFRTNPDANKVNRIPREEMFRFSHQVPSCVLTGGEGPNAPKGCYELDTAATPLELLQIVTEVKEEATHPSEQQKNQSIS